MNKLKNYGLFVFTTLVGVSSNASVFAMARDSADIQLNIGAEVVWIFN